jgi:quercetin dioxygenase-like cupin family protein
VDKVTLKEAIVYNEGRFTKRIIYKKGNSTVFVLNFLPNQELPAHKHPGSEVFIHVVKGTGTMKIDGKESIIHAEDIIFVEGEEVFAFKNTGTEPVSLYVTLTQIPNEQYVQNI